MNTYEMMLPQKWLSSAYFCFHFVNDGDREVWHEWARGTHGSDATYYKILIAKLRVKKLLPRPWCRLEDDIKPDHKGTVGSRWMDLSD